MDKKIDKKQDKKPAVRRETLKSLTTGQLAGVQGGRPPGCCTANRSYSPY